MVSQSVSRVAQTLIDNDVSIQDALHRQYGNYSAIARILRPRIEQILDRPVKIESIITSVKRARTTAIPVGEDITSIVARSVMNIRTDVAKVSIEKTKRTLSTVRRTLADMKGEFLQIIEGVSEVTIICDEALFDDLLSMFRREDILEETRSLAAIMMHSPREIIHVPGCAIAFYTPLSRRHVNIEETMSCFTDTIILVRMDDAGRAFTTLTEMVAEARKALQAKPGKAAKGARHKRQQD